MCYHVNQSSLDFDEDFKVTIPENWAKSTGERFHLNGFAHPKLGVVASDKPNDLQEMEWGLVPFWVKSAEQATDIANKTLNAKAETIFELPSFRAAILKRRCIIPVTGFYEWRHYKSKTYPYFIHPKGLGVFQLAGIWEELTDKETGEIKRTCSIITTEANLLMAQIHNTKKRMPLILDVDNAKKWIESDLKKDEIQELMNPISMDQMASHTISRLVTSRTEDSNVKEVTGKAEYAELPEMVD
ncbi:SOS response-associated peptidase [uncultured Algoriphagus sp.]|uniref:SOS response-associated peptidase n=1 Tax=uncultured Algoriphagus sp. TaxID=417365 RepID=UPI0030EC7EE5|tara:strand:+ start:304 stop:1032 length:729 start_codon:yes stop_codon:yes gene_type:complete